MTALHERLQARLAEHPGRRGEPAPRFAPAVGQRGPGSEHPGQVGPHREVSQLGGSPVGELSGQVTVRAASARTASAYSSIPRFARLTVMPVRRAENRRARAGVCVHGQQQRPEAEVDARPRIREGRKAVNCSLKGLTGASFVAVQQRGYSRPPHTDPSISLSPGAAARARLL